MGSSTSSTTLRKSKAACLNASAFCLLVDLKTTPKIYATKINDSKEKTQKTDHRAPQVIERICASVDVVIVLFTFS